MPKIDLVGYLRQSGGNRRASLAVSKLVLQFTFNPVISSSATGVTLPEGAIPLSAQNISGGASGAFPTVNIGVSGNPNGFADDLAGDAMSGDVITGSILGKELTENTEVLAGAGSVAATGGSVLAAVTYIMADDGQPDISTPSTGTGIDTEARNRIDNLEDALDEDYLTAKQVSESIDPIRIEINGLEGRDDQFQKITDSQFNETEELKKLLKDKYLTSLQVSEFIVPRREEINRNASKINGLEGRVDKNDKFEKRINSEIEEIKFAIEAIDGNTTTKDLFLLRERLDNVEQNLGTFVDPEE